MALIDLVMELKNCRPKLPEKKEPERIRKIRQRYLEMNSDAYWEKRVRGLISLGSPPEPMTAEYEYLKEKLTAEFERDEAIMKGYGRILDNPEQIDKIEKEVKKQVEEYRLLLESLEGIHNSLQMELSE